MTGAMIVLSVERNFMPQFVIYSMHVLYTQSVRWQSRCDVITSL